jgi:hypothetical protein
VHFEAGLAGDPTDASQPDVGRSFPSEDERDARQRG